MCRTCNAASVAQVHVEAQKVVHDCRVIITLKPAPLSTNHIYKIAGRPFPRMYMTKEGVTLKESYQHQAKAQWRKPPMKGALSMVAIIYYGDRRKRDWDNGNKVLFDALSGIVYDDDSQIEQMTVVKRYDKLSPRVEISL